MPLWFLVLQKIENYSIVIVSVAKTNNHDDSIDVNMDQPNVKRWSYYYSTTFKRNDDHTREKIKLSFVAIWSLHRVWMWLLSTCCQLCCVCTFRSSFSSQRMCVYLCSRTFKGDRQSEMDIYPLTLSFTFSWSRVKTSQK